MLKEVESRFALFRDLIGSVSPIYVTELDEKFRILYTNHSDSKLFLDFFIIEAAGMYPQGEELSAVAATVTKPFIYTNMVGMTWISDVYMEKGRLQRIFLLGPVFLEDFTLKRIETKLNRMQLSIVVKSQFLAMLRGLPVITLNRYYDFGLMLHRAVADEVISRSDFLYPDRYDESQEPELFSMDFHGVYQIERRICQRIEEGNLNYQKELDELFAVSDNLLKNTAGEQIRRLKNTAVIICTLYAQAAIQGGVELETIYTMRDRYIGRIEEAKNFTIVKLRIEEMTASFARMVSRHKMQCGLSPQVKKACDFINTHLENNIDIHELARKMGYSSYYFSGKFKKELGMSLREYVRSRRIEKGKELLRDTNQGIVEISLSLGYESTSYFCKIFRKAVGMSPGEYRLAENSQARKGEEEFYEIKK